MKQRLTYIHKPEDAFDPKQLEVGADSVQVSRLQAAREQRLTLGTKELPQEVRFSLQALHASILSDEKFRFKRS